MHAERFIDTNIVIYTFAADGDKKRQASALLADMPTISTQVLSETTNVALKKLKLPFVQIRLLLNELNYRCRVEVITSSTMRLALDVSERYRYSWFDSLIIAAALEAGCTTLYSEDMQHQQLINNQLTIVNPFVS